MKKRALLMLAVLIILGIGFVVGRVVNPAESPVESPGQDAQGTAVGPTSTQNGVPVGYSRSESGAVAAATNFARVMTGVSGNPDQHRAAMETIAAPEWKERARELADNALAFLRDRYEDGSASFTPVRYRVADYTEDAAVVEIWGVTLISEPKSDGIDESWVTGTIELRWVGDWRVVGGGSVIGPTPQLLQTREGAATSVLDDFEGYGYAPFP